MLVDTMRQFAVEMEARKPLRPSGTRHRAEIDTLSGVGAARLSQIIKKFWESAGFEVTVEIVPFAAGKGSTVYGLRSNLVAGLPPTPATRRDT